ncbi:MAG: ABC transporter ATP-binding protein [Pirellulaceae bacterium]
MPRDDVRTIQRRRFGENVGLQEDRTTVREAATPRDATLNTKPDDPIVVVENLTKDYGRLRALDDVSLNIRAGVTGLLGPNGSGKSTFIKVLLGLVRITSGGGRILGMTVGRQTRQIRHCIGYMPEDDCYIAGMTGVESVQFVARLSGLPSIEALRRSHEILDFCDAGQERYRAVETFSTGMRQKLKFAQAIVHDPPLIILDEPTSGLDPQERQAMLGRVRILSQRAGKSVLLCTHILPDVQAVCDDVVILAQGRVRVSESLEKLSRPTSPTLQVRVVGAAEALVDRLRQDGRRVDVDSKGVLAVSGGEGEVAESVWRCAREVGVGVSRMESARNSLEQVFLDTVREKQHADS